MHSKNKAEGSGIDECTVLNTAEKQKRRASRARLTIFEIALFSMFGALMFVTKMLMEFLPNIHLLSMFIMVFTIVYRFKALIPIYIYVLLNGVVAGFAPWWVPYLYIWTVLWAVTMLLPRNMPKKAKVFVYPLICALHGLLFGVLYAPAQALMFGLSFEQTIAWIVSGLGFDALHCVGDFVSGFLIYPLTVLLDKLNRSVSYRIGC